MTINQAIASVLAAITGSGKKGYIPIWTGKDTLGISTIDSGQTTPDTLTLTNTNIMLNATGNDEGVTLQCLTGGGISLVSSNVAVIESGDILLIGNTFAEGTVSSHGQPTDNAGQITLVNGAGSYAWQHGSQVGGAYIGTPIVITKNVTNPANDASAVVTVDSNGITITNTAGLTDTYNFIAWPGN